MPFSLITFPQFLSDIVTVGAALSREWIAHECPPTAMSDMFDCVLKTEFAGIHNRQGIYCRLYLLESLCVIA